MYGVSTRPWIRTPKKLGVPAQAAFEVSPAHRDEKEVKGSEGMEITENKAIGSSNDLPR
jgi:hypothetical protein